MSEGHVHVVFAALVKNLEPLYLFLLNHRRPEIGKEEEQCPVEVRRRNAKDGERMLVDLNNTSHDVAIVLKLAVPIFIADYEIGSTVGAMLVGIVEEAAKERLNAHRVEVVSGDFVAPGLGRIGARVQPNRSEDIRG